MTDLTEQWKKGELSGGWYWVEYSVDGINGVEMMKYIPELNGFSFTIIKQVLAPVPSYEEWEQLQNWADFTDDYHALKEQKEIAEYQNAELKDTIEALKSELKEVCDVLIRKCPEMKEWVMLNWKNLYELEK